MRALRVVALCAGAAGLVSGCAGGGDDGGGDARKGGSITVALAERPDTADPALADRVEVQRALRLAYAAPLKYRDAEGRAGTELVPALASELPEPSSDGLEYELVLRPGLRFSRGTPLRARDVAATLVRTRRMGGEGARLLAAVAEVEADDRRRAVRIRLRRPDPRLPHALATTYAGVVPAGTPARDLTARLPRGLGPYRLRSTRDGLSLVRRRGFELPGVRAGNLDRITLRPQGAPEAEQAVADGRLDVSPLPAPRELLPQVRSEYQHRYRERVGLATRVVLLDPRRRPFDDFRVREALGLAIDQEAVGRLLDGMHALGCTVLPPTVAGHRAPDSCPQGDPSEPRDLRRAARLIEDAGARRASVAVAAGGDEAGRRLARYVAGVARKLGLRARVSISSRGAGAVVAQLRPALPHPAVYLRPLSAGDATLARAARRLEASPQAEESRRWATIDGELVERALVVPLGYDEEPVFVSERLDTRNCLSVHPVYGVDLASLCAL